MIDERTFPDVLELLDYWRSHPPVHIAVGALLGSGAPTSHRVTPAASRASTDYGALLGELASSGFAIPPGVL